MERQSRIQEEISLFVLNLWFEAIWNYVFLFLFY